MDPELQEAKNDLPGLPKSPSTIIVPGKGRYNRAMYAAFLKGRAARIVGEPSSACPYEDKRGPRNSVTFSAAFRRAWRDGYMFEADR